MHDTGKNKHSDQDRHRDMPSDDFLPKHVTQSDEQSQRADLTDTATVLTDQQTERIRKLVDRESLNPSDYSFHDSQRSSSGSSIRISCQLTYYRPASHLYGERKQQEDTSCQCGVERVAA